MKIKRIIFILIILVFGIENHKSLCEEYGNLEINNELSIQKEDLPQEFSNKALKTVNEFIQKTYDLNIEWAINFDYITGDILKYGKGENDNVKLYYCEEEFSENHVASIHNHPKNAFGPPSGKNFNIFSRGFEDYELIVGRDGLWILKAKGIHENLIEEVREASIVYYILTLAHCETEENIKEINECEDTLYGGMLSTFINDKNINEIQLLKREYKHD